jgi:GNAT superfamily N-acetyltransferase
MAITYRAEVPEKQAYHELYCSTGWNEVFLATPAELEHGNRASWFTLAAYDGETLVGFGRVVTDHPLQATIYDMIVLPEYQGQGIGSEILHRLVRTCAEHGIRDVHLFCAEGMRAFYERRGFEARTDGNPGMQLKNPQATRGAR